MVEKKGAVPFAMHFTERMPTDRITEIKGSYNEQTQTWEWPADPQDPTKIMSGIQPERPPTTCQRMTQIERMRWVTDTVVDD